MKSFFTFLGTSILCIFLCGCGYRVFSSVTDEGKTIQILPLKNKIVITEEAHKYANIKVYPVELENQITKILKQKFLWQQDIKVVKANADYVLEGELIEFRKNVIAYDNTSQDSFRDEPKEYSLSCKVRVRLRNREGEVIFEKEVSESDVFFVHRETYEDAQEALAEKIAQQVLEEVIFRW